MPSRLGVRRRIASPTCGFFQSKLGQVKKPIWRKLGHWARTCAAPPTRAASAMAKMGGSPLAARKTGTPKLKAMKATFKRPGAKLVARKRPLAFKAATPSDERPMKKMYGNA